MIALASDAGTISLPFFGALKSWQFVFVIVGIPGIFFALLMLTVPEPARRSKAPVTTTMVGNGILAFIRENRRASLGHFLGFACWA